jgi:menaquinone-dependent protoporphyrinogen IX oxidase
MVEHMERRYKTALATASFSGAAGYHYYSTRARWLDESMLRIVEARTNATQHPRSGILYPLQHITATTASESQRLQVISG